MNERERRIDGLLRAAGVSAFEVGIGRGDDVTWATFSVGAGRYQTVVASFHAESDEAAAKEIALRARQLGIALP